MAGLFSSRQLRYLMSAGKFVKRVAGAEQGASKLLASSGAGGFFGSYTSDDQSPGGRTKGFLKGAALGAIAGAGVHFGKPALKLGQRIAGSVGFRGGMAGAQRTYTANRGFASAMGGARQAANAAYATGLKDEAAAAAQGLRKKPPIRPLYGSAATRARMRGSFQQRVLYNVRGY